MSLKAPRKLYRFRNICWMRSECFRAWDERERGRERDRERERERVRGRVITRERENRFE